MAQTEISDADREQARTVLDRLEVGRRGPKHQLNVLEQVLAEQREQLTRVDLYDVSGPIEAQYGNSQEMEAALRAAGDDYPNLLVSYTLTLPDGHQFRLSPAQTRELLDELVTTVFTEQANEIQALLP